MHKLKLTYFDMSGGRGEPARLAMHIGGIEFEDFRFQFGDFEDIKTSLPLKQVPVLTVDGRDITQCNSINRFVGKLSGLYPENNLQALLCDEIMAAVEDVMNGLVATFTMEAAAQQQAREALIAGPLTQFLKWAQTLLEKQGGEFFADNRLTVADLKMFVWITWLNSGQLDHIPTDLVARVAPKLNEHWQRIGQTPKIVAYYAA